MTPPQHNLTKEPQNSPGSSTPLLTANQVCDNLEVVPQARSLDTTMTDDQFFKRCIHFDFEKVETNNTIDDTQPNSSCFVP